MFSFQWKGHIKKNNVVKSLGGGDGIDSPAYQSVPSPLQASTLWRSEGPLRLLRGGEGRGGEAQTLRPLVLILKVLVALVTNWWVL